jgi:tetratricopeptide (TPR) repeat protein
MIKPFVSPKRDRDPPAATASHASEAARLARRAIDVAKSIDYTREGLAAAADDARRASEADPSLALAWGARARVEATWLNRIWDQSENRRRSTHEFAKRALALDPEEPNALWSQGLVIFVQGSLPEAEATYRRALKASPDDNYIRRSLATVCDLRGRHEESSALLEEAIRRDPRDPLNHYNLALNTLYDRANSQGSAKVDLALAHFDRALEIQPMATALLWKIHIQAALKGDLEAANATLGRLAALPLEQATEDRAIFYRMWIPLLQQQPGKALSAAGLTTTTYFSEGIFAGPIGWLKAAAHRQAKRESAATEELRAAETVLRARLAANPDALRTQAELAVTMALLGRKDEAAKQFERFDKSMREKGTPGTLLHVRFHSAMRDAKRASAAIREARSPATAYNPTVPLWLTETVLSRDPWYDGVRGQPEFKALLQEIAAGK